MYKSALDVDKMRSTTKVGALGTICRDPYRLGSLSVPNLTIFSYSMNHSMMNCVVNCPKN